MPSEKLYPGQYVLEGPAGPGTISAFSTATVLFVGWAPQGPENEAQRVADFAGFASLFGGYDERAWLGYAVAQFFTNGGADAHIIRLCGDRAGIDPNDPAFVTAAMRLFDDGGPVDRIDLFTLMCVPGLTDKDALEALQARARERRFFLIADCPQDATPDDAIADRPQAEGRDCSALYFPWIMAPDPLLGGVARAFPPSGCIAGLYARTDRQQGVWKAPAGTGADLKGISGLAAQVDEDGGERLNNAAVNCLRSFSGTGRVVWGARTLAGDRWSRSDWKYVPVRRTALFLEASLLRGTRWAVFEPNDEALWSRIRLQVGSFLHALFLQGAFQGVRPRDAYFARCDASTMSASDIDNGVLNIEIGFAPLRPAEFVIIRIRQMVGQGTE